MRFTTGVLVGLGVGYYFGTRAGRERHEEIEQWIERVRASDGYQQASARVGAMVGDAVGEMRSGMAAGLADAISPEQRN